MKAVVKRSSRPVVADACPSDLSVEKGPAGVEQEAPLVRKGQKSGETGCVSAAPHYLRMRVIEMMLSERVGIASAQADPS